MGFVKHDAIIVTSFKKEHAFKAYTMAVKLSLNPSQPRPSQINDYWTFFVPPDGSKSGWPHRDIADKRRETFTEWMHAQELYLEWVHVSYGQDQGDSKVENQSLI